MDRLHIHRHFHGVPLRRTRFVALLALLGMLALGGSTALAGEFISQDLYRLPPGETLRDDLYVGADQVYIEGTLDGDLYAAAAEIHITGTVTGDVFAAANSVIVRGPVGDDLFAAGNAVWVDAPVGGDLLAAGGGNVPGLPVSSAEPGVHLTERAQVGGDSILMGGRVEMAGQIGQDLHAFGAQVQLRGRVAGDARISAERLAVDPEARIQGMLRYSVPEELKQVDAVAGQVVYEPPETEERPSPLMQVFRWSIRTVLVFVGFLVLGLALGRLAPDLLRRPLQALQERPLEAGIWGLVAGILLALIPLLSGMLVLFTWIFWGLWPALLVALVLFGGVLLLWTFSPVITGLWLGERIRDRLGPQLPAWTGLVLGLAVLVFLGRLPYVGGLVYLVSFLLALGGLLRGPRVAPSAQAG